MKHEEFVHFSLFLFALTSVLTGPVRWIFAISKLTPFIYLPLFLLIVAICKLNYRNWNDEGLTRIQLGTYLAILYAFFLGMCYLDPKQVGFGFYILLPFFFGLSASSVVVKNYHLFEKYFFILWIIATFGVIVNFFVTYPWEGFTYEVAGQSIESSREWENTGGGKRHAGLSRASFDAAIQIQICALGLVMLSKKKMKNAIIWILSAVGIALTTSKGIYNVYMVLTPIVLMKEKLSSNSLRFLPFFFGVVGLYLPVSTNFIDYNFQINDPVIANLTFSFYDRLNNMWPEGWTLIREHGHYILGRGFGGVGTAQGYFEPEKFNAGDNLYMYGFIIYGWPMMTFYIFVFICTFWIKPWFNREDDVIYVHILAIFIYGLTTNVIENALFAIVIGIVFSYLLTRFKDMLSSDK